MNQNITDVFLEGIGAISKREFDESLRDKIKNCLLDFLGAYIAGTKALEAKNNEIQDFLSPNSPDPLSDAGNLLVEALKNGLSAHVLELDDGVIAAILHPGAPVISALLPVAKKYNVSGEEFLRSIFVGYESSVALAKAIQPSHKALGYHASATCGMIGATLAIATLLDFTPSQVKSSLSAAVITAGGTLKCLEDRSELKPYNVGYAALNAVASCSVGKVGFMAPSDALGGKRGFLEMMSKDLNLNPLLELDKHASTSLDEVYFKPYAACRYCHPSIDAIFKMKQDHDLDPKAITNIEISTYKWAVEGHDHVDIDSVSSAKMSIPYSVGVALHTGKAGLEEFSDRYIGDTEIARTIRKVTVQSDEVFTQSFPENSKAQVQVHLNDGSKISETIENPKGEPDTPLSNEELEEKFKALAIFGGRSAEESNKILTHARNIEHEFGNLIGLLY